MKFLLLLSSFLAAFFTLTANADEFETDTVKTAKGGLKITFIGHGSLMFTFDGKVIYVDPWSRLADYTKLPKADIILLTHEHPDHFDLKTLEVLQTKNTMLLLTETCADHMKSGIVVHNGDSKTILGLRIESVPAYNIVHMRSDGNPFHPKGVGNGYVITFGDKRVYVAGDTENIPEMRIMKNIDITFLPMNLPYTMTPEMLANAAKTIKPKILYPYHYGETDTSKLVDLLKDVKEIELRIRKMK
ncbi:MAG: MBL fold metallo-hydrolase [Pseudomonadota bacterium]